MAFLRYTLIGGVATATHYAILLVLVELFALPAAGSTTLGASGGALVAYLANRRFTFSGAAPHRLVLPRFIVVATLGAGLNGLIVWAGTRSFQWHYLAVQAIATIAILGLTYRINRRWTFICQWNSENPP